MAVLFIMEELLDILDADGNFTGTTALRSIAHRDGLFHNTVHIWFFTKAGKLLLQQRGKNKKTHPLLWDVSVAGHVSSGDDLINAALREIVEEIGVSILAENLKKIGVFKSMLRHPNGIQDHEFHHTYIAELKVPFQTLKLEENEAEALNLIPLKGFLTGIMEDKNHTTYVPHTMDYFDLVINTISEAIGKQ